MVLNKRYEDVVDEEGLIGHLGRKNNPGKRQEVGDYNRFAISLYVALGKWTIKLQYEVRSLDSCNVYVKIHDPISVLKQYLPRDSFPHEGHS